MNMLHFRNWKSYLLEKISIIVVGIVFIVSVPSIALSKDKVHFQWSWLPTGFYCPISGGIEKGFYTDVDIDLSLST